MSMLEMMTIEKDECDEKRMMRHYAVCYNAADLLAFVLHKTQEEIEEITALAWYFEMSPAPILESNELYKIKRREMQRLHPEIDYYPSWIQEQKEAFWQTAKHETTHEIDSILKLTRRFLLDASGIDTNETEVELS